MVGEGVPQPRSCRGKGPIAHGAELGSGDLEGATEGA